MTLEASTEGVIDVAFNVKSVVDGEESVIDEAFSPNDDEKSASDGAFSLLPNVKSASREEKSASHDAFFGIDGAFFVNDGA